MTILQDGLGRCFGLGLFLAQALVAQAQSDFADFRDVEDFRQRAPEYFGIPENSRHYKPLLRLMDEGIKAAQEMERTKVKPEKGLAWVLSEQDKPKDLPLRRHYRGKSGIDLPAAADFKSPLKIDKEIIMAGVIEQAKAMGPKLEEEIRKSLPFRQLPPCDKSQTEKTKTGNGKLSSDEKKQIVMDVLELRPGTMPADAKTSFGKAVLAYEYGSNPDRRDDWWAERVGAECLPFRLRVTRGHRFMHFGEDALRNYDRNPDGPGEVVKDQAFNSGTDSFRLAADEKAKAGE